MKNEEVKQEPALTRQSRDFDVTEMTKVSLPVGTIQNTIKNKKKQPSTPRKDEPEVGCTPPSSHHKKLLQAVIRQNSEHKLIKQTDTTHSKDSAKVKLDFGKKPSVTGSQLEALRSPKEPIPTQMSQVPIETKPDLRGRLFTPNILTENSSYEREKRRLKAELEDSKVYFFNRLRDEIEQEERYSQLLPNRRIDDFASFIDKQEF